MRAKVEARLQKANEQIAYWIEQQAIAGIQVERWDAVRLMCEELLREEVSEVEDPQEIEEAPGA